LVELFRQEAPEVANGTVEIKFVAREPGARAKIAVSSIEDYIDPIGSLVGQRGVRVSTVTSELNGERIDIIEHSDDPIDFIEEALSPARVHEIELIEDDKRAIITVDEDQLSLAIGRGGQNVRLASRLTGYSLDIQSLADSKSLHDEKVNAEGREVPLGDEDMANEPDFNDTDKQSPAESVAEDVLGSDGSPMIMEENTQESETEEQSSTDTVIDQSPDTDDYKGDQDVDSLDQAPAADVVLPDVEQVEQALSETNEEVREAQEEAFDRSPDTEPVEVDPDGEPVESVEVDSDSTDTDDN
jgi:N utilization substance protein A